MEKNLFKWYLPPLILILFILHLGFVLKNPDRILADPGTGWQLKTGEILIKTWQLPELEPFSYTASETSWVLYQWLFQALLGALQLAGGIPLVTVVCALVLGWTLMLLMQRMVEQKSTIFFSLLAVFAFWLVLTMHIQARPHVMTYLLFCIYLLQFERASREQGTWIQLIRHLLPLPFLMILWCNFHGGFVTGIMLCGIFWVGSVLDAMAGKKKELWEKSLVYLSCFFASGVASLFNPYGFKLHQTIFSYLNFNTLKYYDEFVTPFTQHSANVTIFKGTILLLLLLLARSKTKLSWAEIGCLLVFLYYAIESVRHVILFMLVAVPITARFATQWVEESLPSLSSIFTRITKEQNEMKGGVAYAIIISLVFISLVWLKPDVFRKNLDGIRLSAESVEYIKVNRDKFQRMFNTEDLGGALIYSFSPKIKVFVDDRVDAYGDDFFLETYLPILQMKDGWYNTFESRHITSAILSKDSPIGSELMLRGWSLVHEDELNKLYLKKLN